MSAAVVVVGISAVGVAGATQKASQKQPKPGKVTFAEHIAPIVYKKCASCHRPGEVAPFSLDSYDEVKKRADMVALVAGSRQMPPWKTKPTDVPYANENRLTDAEIQMFQRWAEDGAPKGDMKKAPSPPPAVKDWSMGKPDLVLQMPKPFKLGATGTDEYWNFVIDPGIKEPVYVQGIDAKPGNKRVVHHIIAYLDDSGRSTKMAQGPKARDGGYLTTGGGIGTNPSGSFGGWAPGVAPSMLPAGVGYLLKPGTKIVLQVHYNKSGKEEIDQTKIGLYFLKGQVKAPAKIAWLANPLINIAPGDNHATFTQTVTLPADAVLYNVMPHMHKLGKAMKATAVFADGTKKVLVDVPDWDFNWQLVYAFKQPMSLPKGTKIVIEATYDNSTANPFNPNNPPKRVTWGERTSDEMMLLVATVSTKGKSEYID
ncbi:MAG: cytochrome c [Armatimonadetes bacterium]|nr:cytochrome c [Armatimonadota bacterium]